MYGEARLFTETAASVEGSGQELSGSAVPSRAADPLRIEQALWLLEKLISHRGRREAEERGGYQRGEGPRSRG